MERHDGARLELDQVDHRALAEERPARHALRKLERSQLAEVHELRLHEADYPRLVAVTASKPLPLLRTQAYVDGRWTDADSGETFPVIDPATGETVAEVPRLGAAETRRAIEAAERVFPAWRAQPAKARARALRRLADLMLDRLEDLSVLMTTEQGKPLAESRAEVEYAASFLEWFGEEAKRVYGDTIPEPTPDRRIVVTKHPVGVTAGITPWNFPSAMVTRKAAPALAAGCTMVLKPAEQTPLSALAICELAEEAGLPPGVLSVVTGDAEDAPAIGKEMTSNPTVRKLGFTGSTEVGKLLMRQCADQVKKVSLELGGNAPFIVFDDADLDEAVAGAVLCKYRNSGQTCISANRMLVQDGIFDAFLERFVPAVSELKVGSGLEDAVKVGPLIDRPGLEKVERHVDDARERGAEVLLGGSRHDRGQTFFEPTVLTGLDPDMAMWSEETFGPVAGIARFATEEEAIRVANATPYGLAAYYYSRDVGRVWRVSEALEYGILGINTGFISTEVAPFGGVKESGIGREGSKYGIEEWVELKYLALGGIA
jgi:succinate-semialdehyde dehydrogenase / glutarate-semialdehyde dehydrogenase